MAGFGNIEDNDFKLPYGVSQGFKSSQSKSIVDELLGEDPTSLDMLKKSGGRPKGNCACFSTVEVSGGADFVFNFSECDPGPPDPNVIVLADDPDLLETISVDGNAKFAQQSTCDPFGCELGPLLGDFFHTKKNSNDRAKKVVNAQGKCGNDVIWHPANIAFCFEYIHKESCGTSGRYKDLRGEPTSGKILFYAGFTKFMGCCKCGSGRSNIIAEDMPLDFEVTKQQGMASILPKIMIELVQTLILQHKDCPKMVKGT